MMMTKQEHLKRIQRNAQPGRPRTVTPEEYTPEQLETIDRMATAQCRDTTIAEAIGVEVQVFKRQFAQFCRTKRAQGKAALLLEQYDKAIHKRDTTMLIWCGKQHLGQSDRAEVSHSGDMSLNMAAVALGVCSRELHDALPTDDRAHSLPPGEQAVIDGVVEQAQDHAESSKCDSSDP